MPWSEWQDGWDFTGTVPIDAARHWDPADSADNSGTGVTLGERVAGAVGDVNASHRIADGLPTGHFYRVRDDGTQAHATVHQAEARYFSYGPGPGDLPPAPSGVTLTPDTVIEYESSGAPSAVTFDVPAQFTTTATGADMDFIVSVGDIGADITSTTVGAGTGTIPGRVITTLDITAAASPASYTIHVPSIDNVGTSGIQTAATLVFSPKGFVDGTGLAAHPSTSPFDWATDLTLGDAAFTWTTPRWRYWIAGGGPYWGVRAA